MCGFIVANYEFDVEERNRFNRLRGPDRTITEDIKGFRFVHNLLHITGDKMVQPVRKGGKVCVFNGEIYNFKEFGSYSTDGECILDLYERDGHTYADALDGEFAITIVDFDNRRIVISNDVFATKPIWVCKSPCGFGVASYESSLPGGARKLKGNTTYVYTLQGDLISEHTLRKFDTRQHKKTYDDWINAFEKSIAKRTANTDKKLFLGLSSGYDSGAIACELDKQGSNFKAFTIRAAEDKKTYRKRQSMLKDAAEIKLTKRDFKHARAEVQRVCEPFTYKDKFGLYSVQSDKAAYGLAIICRRASAEGYRIYFSGQGADEILSDYGFAGKKYFSHSGFGGLFPEKLDDFFPWHSFFDGTQIKYLNKEECVAGAFGIETRYPFLDFDLVQEFLWLRPELKNAYYKAPLREYLMRNKYPFNEGVKIGFRVRDNLK